MALPSNIIKACLDECNKSTYRVKIGAVLFRGKRILSTGHNQIRSSKIKYKEWTNSLHAEQDVLRKTHLDWNKLKGSNLLVLKVSKTEKLLSNGAPCEMCRKLITALGIKYVYYSDAYGGISRWHVKYY